MPYAIRLPDGTLVQNIPDDLTPEQAKQRIISAGLIQPPAPPEPTFFGQVKEGFKGLVPGAVGLVEQAAVGASALLPEEYEKPTREAIAKVAGAAKAPFAAAPGYEETVGRKLGEAVGSTVPFLAAGPLGLAGRAAAVGLGVGAGAGEARTRAEKEGATAEQRATATGLGIIPGAMEVFAPFRILSRIPEGEVLAATQRVKRVLQAAGEEAAQEAASGLAQNMIARGVYKPEQELIEGLGEQAAYGGATGAIVQGLMDLAIGRRARGAGTGAETEPLIERRAREAAEAAETPAPVEPAAAPEVPEPVAEAPVKEPPVPAGFVRVYHSGSKGEGDSGRWVSTQKDYAANYRKDLPLFYTDIPETDPRVNNPDYLEQGIKQGFTFNFELTPEEATTLKETPRSEAAPEVPEPIVRKPAEPPAVGIQPAEVDALGITKKQPIYRRLLGKDMENPEQRAAVLADIENYLTKGNGSEESRAKLTEFKERYAPKAPPAPPPPAAEAPAAAPEVTPPTAEAAPAPAPEVPRVEPTEPEAGGAGAPVAGGPTAVTPTEGAGAVEPVRVVPAEPDAEQPAGGEGAESVAVAPAAEPEYTEDDIDRAVDLGVLSEEEAGAYRAELRGEEAPSTAMAAAFEERVAALKAQQNKLRQKNGKIPAPKSKNRAKFDELQAQIDALSPVETGTLKEKLEKAQATGVFTVKDGKPILDIPAVRSALKGRDPKMLKAVLTYIGVDEDGNYLPTTYSADEAAQAVGMAKSSGANVRRIAETLGITADVISRFQAAQTGIIGIAKNVSEASLSGIPVENPKAGLLYETGKKGIKAVGFLRPALTETGGLDFTKLDTRQLADIYSRASRYDAKDNAAVMQQLNAEVEARRKADRKGTDAAINRAYGKLVEEEEATVEREEAELETEPETVEAEDTTRRLSDEETESQYQLRQKPTTGMSKEQVEKAVVQVTEGWTNVPPIEVVQSETDLPKSIQREITEAGVSGQVPGLFNNGKVWLIADNNASRSEVFDTIAHEVTGHYGLRGVLGEKYGETMGRIYDSDSEIRTKADEKMQKLKGLEREVAVEEVLADMQEKDRSRPLFKRIVGMIRTALQKLFKGKHYFSRDQVEDLLRQSRVWVRRGEKPAQASAGVATRFRETEEESPTPIGQFGPIKNASVIYWGDKTGVSVEVFDQDLIDSGVKPSRAVIDQFDLDISRDGKTAEIHTHGVPPSASAALSKYKDQISRVKPVGFSGDPYYKFDPGSFSNKDIRQLIRSLRDTAIEKGIFDNVETVKIRRSTGATAGSPPREINREAALRFRTKPTTAAARGIAPETEKAVKGVDVIAEQAPALTPKGNPALKTRIKFADSLAGLEDVFTAAYSGLVRTATGRLNPMVLLSRALDTQRVSRAVQKEGTLVTKEGLLMADKLMVDGREISYKGTLARIAETAKKEGKTYEQYRDTIDKVLYGHREYNLREYNRNLDQQADALEAAGKTKEAKAMRGDKVTLALDDKQIDALEAAFQNDAFIQGVSKDLDAIRFNLLDKLVEVGRISEDKAKEWKENTGYIPFHRIDQYVKEYDEAGRGTNRGVVAMKKIRKLEGSERATTSPVENFSQFMDWAVGEAMKNEAGYRALTDLELLGSAKRQDDKPAFDSPGGVVTVYEKGVPTKFYVQDPGLFVGLSLQEKQLGSIAKAFQRFGTQPLRAGVTALPPFAVKQVFDDIVRAYTYAGVKNNAAVVKNILLNFPKNWYKEIFKVKDKGIQELENLGVVGTFDFTKQGNLKNILEEAGAKKEGLGSAIFRVMEAGAKASDLAVRQAIYQQVLKETGDVAQAESAAREIINFSRRGAAGAMQTLISVIPFFNAYAQGMDKLATAAAGRVVGTKLGVARSMFYKRMAVLTGLGLAYALLMSDDEDYQALADHVRDTNWILPYGKHLGFTPAIPVPAELAFFFKAIPERVVQFYKHQGTDEERAALDVVKELLVRGVDVFSSPNLTPQLIRPFLENITNYSWFLNRPLESQAQLKQRPFMRAGTSTSDTMKVVAELLEDAANATGIEAIAISPIKLENTIRGLLGSSGGVVLALTDAVINPSRTDRPLHQQLKSQLTGASAVMKDAVGTRYLDKVYKLEADVEQVYNTYNRLLQDKPEKTAEFIEDNKGLYSIRPAVQGLMNAIRAQNAAARQIDKATDITPDERRKRIDELRVQQNDLAKQALMLRKMAMDIQLGK